MYVGVQGSKKEFQKLSLLFRMTENLPSVPECGEEL